jgi:16S rRNA (cytidine1402-2'-O)-methyltransferase
LIDILVSPSPAMHVAQFHGPRRGPSLQDPAVPDLFDLARQQHYPEAALYIVATPIGNLADITLRALHVLSIVERIAAEDTRNTQQMLTRYGIEKSTLAVHEHNEREAAERVIEYLRAGERVAYVSDAGTPGISDPGSRLVEAVRAAGLTVVPIPGASALVTALSVAGAWASTFTFAGFLPTKARQRSDALQVLAASPHALVFYEAPHRIVETVSALAETLGGERKLLIARELTKLHEALHVCTLAEGPTFLKADPNRQRGEFVLVVEGYTVTDDGATNAHDATLKAVLEALPVSAAVKLAATLTGAPRNELYKRALELKGEAEEDGDKDENEEDNG